MTKYSPQELERLVIVVSEDECDPNIRRNEESFLNRHKVEELLTAYVRPYLSPEVELGDRYALLFQSIEARDDFSTMLDGHGIPHSYHPAKDFMYHARHNFAHQVCAIMRTDPVYGGGPTLTKVYQKSISRVIREDRAAAARRPKARRIW